MSALLDPFALPFMQRAALEIVLLAPLAGFVGAQIVLRNLAFYTHAVGTAAFPGLVLAGPAGIPPALAALGVAGAFAILLERLGRISRIGHDAVTALLLVGALSVGIVLASDVFTSGSKVDQLLFGSLIAIGEMEILTTTVVVVTALAVTAGARRSWIAGGFDGAMSRSLGLRAQLADWALVTVIAITVIATLDAVGALLVSAILVIPAATARLFARSVSSLELAAAAIALAEGLAGLRLAYELNVPPGAAIAVLGGGVFAIALVVVGFSRTGTLRLRADP